MVALLSSIQACMNFFMMEQDIDSPVIKAAKGNWGSILPELKDKIYKSLSTLPRVRMVREPLILQTNPLILSHLIRETLVSQNLVLYASLMLPSG